MKIPDFIENLEPYPPGKPIKELERELGLTGVMKLASNENPYGPSPRAAAAVAGMLDQLHRYPDGAGYYLKHKLARVHGLAPEAVVLGCGTNEIIDLVGRVFVGRLGRAVLPQPSFLIYQKFLQAAGAGFELIPLRNFAIDPAAMAAAVDKETDLVILCNPNNPTGTVLEKREIENFLDQVPEEVIVLVDEAYIEFVRQEGVGSAIPLLADHPNLIVSRTFSKIYGLAGLRVGYGLMSPRLADYLNRVRQPFNVTAPALVAAEAALDDHEYLNEVRRRTWAGVDWLTEKLAGLGLEPRPTQTNFLIFRSPRPANEVYQAMLRRGVIIRSMASFGLPDYLRVNVGLEAENERFITELAGVLKA